MIRPPQHSLFSALARPRPTYHFVPNATVLYLIAVVADVSDVSSLRSCDAWLATAVRQAREANDLIALAGAEATGVDRARLCRNDARSCVGAEPVSVTGGGTTFVT